MSIEKKRANNNIPLFRSAAISCSFPKNNNLTQLLFFQVAKPTELSALPSPNIPLQLCLDSKENFIFFSKLVYYGCDLYCCTFRVCSINKAITNSTPLENFKTNKHLPCKISFHPLHLHSSRNLCTCINVCTGLCGCIFIPTMSKRCIVIPGVCISSAVFVTYLRSVWKEVLLQGIA